MLFPFAQPSQAQNDTSSLNTDDKPTVELGTVQWGRDLKAALAKSKKTKIPVFLQFQEVPG